MSRPRVETVVSGQVVTTARPQGIEQVEAVAIGGGRVLGVGSRRAMRELATATTEFIEAEGFAVMPGLHDFHLHLAGLARARRAVALDGAERFDEVVRRVAAAASVAPVDGWLTGRGWDEATLDQARIGLLVDVLAGRRAYLQSHDGHSAWASPAGLQSAGITADSPDPPGGRIERSPDGSPNGVLRERAMDAVGRLVSRLGGAALAEALSETVGELSALGITAATDAGDATDDNGVGEYARLGDSFSSLVEVAPVIGDRLRLTLNLPADALRAAAEMGLRSGRPLGVGELRCGWAKVYADGALGSGTAALFEPASCGGGTGILRHGPDELDELVRAGRSTAIGLAIHAIGDRAAAGVLDAFQRASQRPIGTPPDRLEHAQLVRPVDRPRFAALGVTASMQPIHAAADRERVEACWAGRVANAYAWRSLAGSGALLAFGSDAPVEAVNPWLGVFAAVHRRLPWETGPDWAPAEALGVAEALSAYTIGPARAADRLDEGHLMVGARADLAVLNLSLEALLAGDGRLADVRSQLTLVGGREVHRG